MNKKWRNMLIFMGVFVLICWWLITPSEDYESEQIGNKEVRINDQFPNIEESHWSHMPITYHITNEEVCKNYESGRIRRAFEKIQNSTDNILQFNEVNASADINVKCSFIEDCYEYKIDLEDHGDFYFKTEWESICDHALGLAEITDYENNRLLNAEIEMIGLDGFVETTGKGMSGFRVGRCGVLNTEIHEILHTLGVGHSNNPKSIMNPSEEFSGLKIRDKETCENYEEKIDDEIISCLKYIYSNGEFEGDCSDVNFLGDESDCGEGWYPVEDSDNCCPEPNMIINEDGYCSYF